MMALVVCVGTVIFNLCVAQLYLTGVDCMYIYAQINIKRVLIVRILFPCLLSIFSELSGILSRSMEK